MTYKAVTYELQDGVAILTLNRPDQRNALDMDMRTEIGDVVTRVRQDDDVKALLITGAGGAVWAGGDLKSLSEGKRPAAVNRERVRSLHIWFHELVNLEKPVIAAVDGSAFGAGFCMALAADFVLCSDRAKFCAAFARIGLVPDLGGLFLLPRVVGLQRAKEIFFTGRVVGVAEAQALGIALEVHPQAELMERALEFAGRFRNASTLALGMAKGILNHSFELDQRTLAEQESYAQAICIETDYHQQAVQRFLNKEKTLFDWDAAAKQARRSE
ncbi:MAG: enoyl-CoA hydratase/isomerase family protein [Gammaproteobacteria bacterium]|nr:enoyl-CoA hydratase/isomerase family protein [Gammaproteobacteria bacterium]